MNPEQEKLLEEFESFECDLEVEAILKKVKTDRVSNEGVTEFAEQLKKRDREKRAAQAAREVQVEEQWSPRYYPQLTSVWFIEGLDYCCNYWRYQFKRRHTPPPAPPPSPNCQRRRQPPPPPCPTAPKTTNSMSSGQK